MFCALQCFCPSGEILKVETFHISGVLTATPWYKIDGRIQNYQYWGCRTLSINQTRPLSVRTPAHSIFD